MIRPKCMQCNSPLKDFGGILLSPPNQSNSVKKYHLCVWCYQEIYEEIRSRSKEDDLERKARTSKR